MSLTSFLRPRVALTTGAALVLAAPLTILALAGATLAVVAVRRDKAVLEILTQGAENLKQGAKIAIATGERVAAIDSLLGSLFDIKSMVKKADHVLARAEDRAVAPSTSPAPAEPDALDKLAARRAEEAGGGTSPAPLVTNGAASAST